MRLPTLRVPFALSVPVLALGLVLAACGDDDDPAPATNPPGTTMVDDTMVDDTMVDDTMVDTTTAP